jgi:ATP phosphoribosyltransferase
VRLGTVSGSRVRGDGALKLAVPRGALLEWTLELLDRVGVETTAIRSGSRALVFDAGDLVLVTMRPSDVPT